MSGQVTPNPGSPEATTRGCTCPVADNAHGQGVPTAPGQVAHWIAPDCPLHGASREGGKG